jgi:hypothetical protein
MKIGGVEIQRIHDWAAGSPMCWTKMFTVLRCAVGL